jgi:HK97 family phage major capsid protein
VSGRFVFGGNVTGEKQTREVEYRIFSIDGTRADEDTRTVEASLSSEEAVRTWQGWEILSHAASAVDMVRAEQGLPLLESHDMRQQIGIIERVRIEGKKLRGRLRFGKTARAAEIWEDVKSGIRRNMSIGFAQLKPARTVGEREGEPLVMIERWQPIEASLVAVGLDHTVGVGRDAGYFHREGFAMSDENGKDTETATRERVLVQGDVTEERSRVTELRAMGRLFSKYDDQLNALADNAIEEGTSVDAFRKIVLSRIDNTRTAPQGGAAPMFDERRLYQQREHEVVFFRDMRTGDEVRGYRGPQPIFKHDDTVDLGTLLRAILLNDTSRLSAEIRSGLLTGSDSSGGYLMAPAVSEMLIDLARATSVSIQAGATTLPMETGEMTIARVTGDPTVAWRAELQATTGTKPTFGRFVLRPRMLAAVVPVSLELLEDAPNAGDVIAGTLTSAMGVELDRALLEGTGAENQPQGVVNTLGINTTASVGTPTTYAEVSTAIGQILGANYAGEVGNLAWINNPTVATVYDQLVTGITSDNTPLRPTPWVETLRRFYTTSLAANASSEYNQIIGAFNEMLIGARYSGVVIDVIDAGQVTDAEGDTTNAVSQFARFIRARLRADVVLMRPAHFSVLAGTTTT